MKYIVLLMLGFLSCKSNSQKIDNQGQPKSVDIVPTVSEKTTEAASRSASEGMIEKIEKTEEEWKEILTDKEYYVLREEGTERSFTSDLLKEKRKGTFVCAACQLPLFSSETKFESGTGWPSFYKPIDLANIGQDTDYKIGYARTEVECGRCDSHLGHVFDDGPKPTGLRYCINGVALDFQPEE